MQSIVEPWLWHLQHAAYSSLDSGICTAKEDDCMYADTSELSNEGIAPALQPACRPKAAPSWAALRWEQIMCTASSPQECVTRAVVSTLPRKQLHILRHLCSQCAGAAASLKRHHAEWNALADHARGSNVKQPAMLQGTLHPHQLQVGCSPSRCSYCYCSTDVRLQAQACAGSTAACSVGSVLSC